jgi:hypothetical protein
VNKVMGATTAIKIMTLRCLMYTINLRVWGIEIPFNACMGVSVPHLVD